MSKHTISKNKKNIRRPHILENLTYLGDDHIQTNIDLIQYNAKNYTVRQIKPTINLTKEKLSNNVNWFKITGIADVELINNICKEFGVQRFDVKDLLANQQVTKIVSYEKHTYILISCPTVTDNNLLKMDQIAFILTQDAIVSIQERNMPIFDDAIVAIESNKLQIRDKGCDYLLYILMNCVYSFYYDSIIKIADLIDEMEDALIAKDTDDIDVMRFIQDRKKDYSRLKRMISPLREEYTNLLHNSNSLISHNGMIYFNDFDDRLRIASEDIEALHESTSSLTDLYFNNNNLKMNHIIKKLTVVSTIFIPLTFMVGVWGMNFRIMPELNWKYGYFYAWGIMISVALLAIAYLKKKKWF